MYIFLGWFEIEICKKANDKFAHKQTGPNVIPFDFKIRKESLTVVQLPCTRLMAYKINITHNNCFINIFDEE